MRRLKRWVLLFSKNIKYEYFCFQKKLKTKLLHNIFFTGLKNFAIIDNMKTQYTQTQLNRFHRFCDRHGLTFSTIAEYNGALEQFFSEDDE
jgi:hypothetical protein